MSAYRKIESVDERLAVAEGYIESQNVSKQQLRLLYGAMEKIQMVEIDGLNVGEDEELRERRKHLAVRANKALDLIEKLESEGIDGKAVEDLTGGIAISAFYDLSMVVTGGPPTKLNIEIPPSDSEAFLNKSAEHLRLEEELMRLEKKLMLGYKNSGLLPVSEFMSASVSVFNIPNSFFLPSRAKPRYTYTHSHDMMAKMGALPNGDSEKKLHLLLTYNSKLEFLWITMISQKKDKAEVLYGARHSMHVGLSPALNINRQLTEFSKCGSYIQGVSAWGDEEVTVWVDCGDIGNKGKEKKRNVAIVAKNRAAEEAVKKTTERIFTSPERTVHLERFGRDTDEDSGPKEALAAADCIDEEVGGDAARCTIGILSDPSAKTGTLIPFITPFHRVGSGSSITKILERVGEFSGELTLSVGIVTNSQLHPVGNISSHAFGDLGGGEEEVWKEAGEATIDVDAVQLAVGTGLDAKFDIAVPLGAGAAGSSCVAVRIEYSPERAILVNIALCPNGMDTEPELLQWMGAEIVIDGNTDPAQPLVALVAGTESGEGVGGSAAAAEEVDVSAEGENGQTQTQKSCSWACPSEATRLKDAGNQLLRGGGLDDLFVAHYLYSLACAHDPGNSVLWSNRSACALHLASLAGTGSSYYLEEALNDAYMCAGLQPDWAKAWGRVGDAHFRRGKFQLAVASYKRALSLDPASTGINDKLLSALGKVRVEKEQKEEEERRRKQEQAQRGKREPGDEKAKSKSQCSCM